MLTLPLFAYLSLSLLLCAYMCVDVAEDPMFSVKTEHVLRRPSYRDTVGSTGGRTDLQLRPNLLIAMVVVRVRPRPDHAHACV
jgi:hypothetical protein